jgi:hypothetical protein
MSNPPISREALISACVAFGFEGTERETELFTLKLMKAIGAYLQATNAAGHSTLLSALIRQIELGDYTDKHGHKLTDNVCFIKAKEAVGE